MNLLQRFRCGLFATALAATCIAGWAKDITLLNVSYDPTRELYADYNAAFAAYWQGKTGDVVTVKQSHGGSGKQARASSTAWRPTSSRWPWRTTSTKSPPRRNLLPADWQKRLPNNSAPYTSTDRVPGAQGQSQGHQGLGRPGPPGRGRHHAQSEDFGWRALELPGGLGLRR